MSGLRDGMLTQRPGLSPADMVRLSELAPVGLVALSPSRVVEACNPAACEMLRKPLSALCGEPIRRFVGQGPSGGGPMEDLIDRAEAHCGQVSIWRCILRGPDLVTDPLDVHVGWHGDAGFLIALCPSARQGLADAGGNMGDFAKVFGHEVKTPLAAISGAAQLLQRRDGQSDDPLLDILIFEAERLGRVITRLTDLETLSAPRFQPINVHEVLDRVVDAERLRIDGQGVRLVRDYDPSLPEIEADPDHLHQAVQNLVRNAIECPTFAQNGKEVTVSTHFALAGRLPGRERGGGLEIRVTDNGAGIAEEHSQAVMRPFYTTKSTGTGIGLSVVQDTVASHGGVLDLRSVPGETVFSLILPLPRRIRGGAAS